MKPMFLINADGTMDVGGVTIMRCLPFRRIPYFMERFLVNTEESFSIDLLLRPPPLKIL